MGDASGGGELPVPWGEKEISGLHLESIYMYAGASGGVMTVQYISVHFTRGYNICTVDVWHIHAIVTQ